MWRQPDNRYYITQSSGYIYLWLSTYIYPLRFDLFFFPQEVRDLQEQLADLMRHLETQQAISNAPDETRQVIFISSALAMLTRCMQLSNVPSSIPRLKDFFASERSIESYQRLDIFFQNIDQNTSKIIPFSRALFRSCSLYQKNHDCGQTKIDH